MVDPWLISLKNRFLCVQTLLPQKTRRLQARRPSIEEHQLIVFQKQAAYLDLKTQKLKGDISDQSKRVAKEAEFAAWKREKLSFEREKLFVEREKLQCDSEKIELERERMAFEREKLAYERQRMHEAGMSQSSGMNYLTLQ